MESCLTPFEVERRKAAYLDQLQAHLQSRLHGKVQSLQLLQADQGIVLRGHARTYYAKQVAQHAVMEATDFPILTNEIEVF